MGFIRKRGRIWYAYWYENGRQIAKAISSWKEIAEKYLRRKEYELDSKRALGITEKIKFIDFTEKYLQFSKTTKSPSSYRRDTL